MNGESEIELRMWRHSVEKRLDALEAKQMPLIYRAAGITGLLASALTAFIMKVVFGMQ